MQRRRFGRLTAVIAAAAAAIESASRGSLFRVGKAGGAPDSTCRDEPDCPTTLDAGLAQIASGRARCFRKYADERSPEDRARYEAAEQEARSRKLNLWRDADPVPPWEWRAARSSR